MKRCPECRKDYVDDSLLYCLDDGTALVQGSIADEAATAVLPVIDVSDQIATRTFDHKDKSARRGPVLSRKRLPWLLVAMFAVIGLAGLTSALWRDKSPELPLARLAFQPPANLSFNDVQPDYATISPDGRKIAFSATADGKNMLYVRDLEGFEAKLLPGSENPIEPFWSPDSKSVAYGSNGKLKRSDVSGGIAQVLCDAARMVGGSWAKDGIIVFAPDYRTTLVQVSAKGGEPTPVVMDLKPDDVRQHRWPYFLPDGRHFLFSANGVKVGSLDSPEVADILPDATGALYSKDGWLIFIRNDALVAQPFDASGLAVTGEPVTLIDSQKNWNNYLRFSVSDTGIVVWQGVWEREYQLAWFDREGKPVGSVDAPAKIAVGQDPRISPDGKRVVIKRNPPMTLWVFDLEKATSVRITSDFAQMPLWSPDGSRIAYAGAGGLVTKASNGLGEPQVILPSSSVGATFPCCWSPDGRFIIYQKRGVKTRLDLYAVPLEGEKKEIQLLNSPFDELSPALSPDGKWLAYSADDTGGIEVYVQPFSPDGKNVDRKRISTTGGRMPVWRRDGSELFFIAADGQLMAASVKGAGDSFEFTTPKPLFATRMLAQTGSFHEFDVSPDGQRFLIGTLIGEAKAPQPTVLMNWTALLKK